MKFKEYGEKARSTAIYPFMGDQNGLDYALTGLIGELGEMFNVVQKMIRDDRWNITDAKIAKLSQEAGGCVWFISQAYFELKMDDKELEETKICDLHDIFYEEHSEEIREYLKRYGQLKTFRKILTDAQAYAIGALSNFDALEETDEVYAEDALEELGDLLFLSFSCFSSAIGVLGIDLGDVCKDNLELLFARKEAGTIQGSGDGVEGRV